MPTTALGEFSKFKDIVYGDYTYQIDAISLLIIIVKKYHSTYGVASIGLFF